MKMQKELSFDFYLCQLNISTQDQAFQILSEKVHKKCGVDSSALLDIFSVRLAQRSFGMGDGVAVFDVKSSAIKKPVLTMVSFADCIDFDSLDDKPVDLMAAVISPLEDSSEHLQKLAHISRVLRCDALREALREARDPDAMRVLFMPSQDWMIAA